MLLPQTMIQRGIQSGRFLLRGTKKRGLSSELLRWCSWERRKDLTHSSTHQFANNDRLCYSVWAWGTSKHGAIPATSQSDASSSASTAASLLDGGSNSKVLDHPHNVNIDELLKEKGTGSLLKDYVCGPNNSAVILENGNCFVWGSNDQGQLGLGSNASKAVSELRPLFPPEESVELQSWLTNVEKGVKKIKLGKKFSAVIDSDDDLHTFGHGGTALGGMGWLGLGDGDARPVPTLVQSLREDGCSVKDVSLGDSHMIVLTTEGEVLTAGSGSYGRLGNLETIDQLFLEPVELLAREQVTAISAGGSFTLVLTKDGIVHSWGRNDKGQLGTGGGMMVDMYSLSEIPAPVEGQLEGRTVVKIAAGHQHAAAITDRGELFFWGMNRYLEPQLVSSLLHTKCVDVVCGENYTMVLDEGGKLYSFGNGKTGVLGQCNTKTLNEPTLVEGMLDHKIVSMSAGLSHFACITEDDIKISAS